MERVIVARTSKLPKRLQPMLATLTDGRYRETRSAGEVRHVFEVAGRPPTVS